MIAAALLVLLLGIVPWTSSYHQHRPLYIYQSPYSPPSSSTTALYSLFDSLADTFSKRMDTLKSRVTSSKDSSSKSEDDELYDILNDKPWRASKVKHLKYHYRPCKESWKERLLVDGDDDTVYLYATPDTRFGYDSARPDDLWTFPWLWSKSKTERMAWIQKTFNSEVEALTVQEHMELDAFYSEFDMPVRWGLLRIKELDVLNVMALNLVFWTDFNGVRPTDLGLRPDGTVRSCPVQFHNCISSSNDPRDVEHYVKPLKWSRAKSPDQAYDEIKSIYFNYPKRGLRWTYGWIDRGGWKPQQFSGDYFYAQANSLSWQFTDDVEFVLDIEKREVQYRSSTRLGQIDWDVERLRYNQFVRMLEKKGGWEVEPVERLRRLSTTPYRWTQVAVDKALMASEQAGNAIIGAVSEGEEDLDSVRSKVMRRYEEIVQYMQPYIQPVYDQLADQVTSSYNSFILEPRVAAALQTLQDLEMRIEQTISSSGNGGNVDLLRLVESYFEKIVDLLPAAPDSSDGTTSPLRIVMPQPTPQSAPSVEKSVGPANAVEGRPPTSRMTDRLGDDARKVIKRLSRFSSSQSTESAVDAAVDIRDEVNDIEYVIDSR